MDSNTPIINIRGTKIGLGPMSKKYLDLYTGWVNDFETMSYLSKFIKPMTLEAEEEWYSNLLKLDDNISFTVFDLETQKQSAPSGSFTSITSTKPANLAL